MSEMWSKILPVALKTDIVDATSRFVAAILGGSGGIGNNWGVLLNGTGAASPPCTESIFRDQSDTQKLKRLVEEYGPLWQVGAQRLLEVRTIMVF